ncbi:MAG TPA: fibronectin type III domain-containing protein [Candidatus Acidoferrales bacterium]|nr:fibronectin type III domain-containing protein [Candidatus Acidoferrales bacterium]
MPEYLAPGVYIEEVDAGPVPIQGVATSTGGIIGLCQRGPINTPTLITSLGAFTSTFGGTLPYNVAPLLNANVNNVAYGVQGFFNNGGTMLYVVRVAPIAPLVTVTPTYFTEQYALQNASNVNLIVQASDAGSWANPQFGVLYGRYQQTDGLSITFAPAANMPYSIQPGSTTSTVNLRSTVGLYVGAVVAWSPSAGTYQYGVVSGLTGTTITLAGVPFASAPSSPGTLALVEFSLTVNYLQAGNTAQSETWSNLNLNASTQNYVGTIVGALNSSTGASNLIRAGLSGTLDFGTNAAYVVAPGTAPGVPPAQSGVTSSPLSITGLTDGTEYYFTVAAVNASGVGTESAEVSATPQTATTAPAAPTGVTATAGDTSVTLSWTAATSAASYNVYQGTSHGGEGATPVQSGIIATSATITGLTNGTTYYFTIAAVNTIGAGAQSAEVSATPELPAVPAVPTGVAATPGSAQVTLTWMASAGATSYDVYQGTTPGGEGASPVQSGIAGTSTVVDALANGTEYYFTVTAVNAGGASAASSEVNATPTAPTTAPAAPAGVTTTPGSTQVTLSWTPLAGASSYNIYQGLTPGGESTTPVATGITATSYTVTGLTNGVTYYFTVAGVNTIGAGTPSSEVSAAPASVPVPAAPSGLTASAADGIVILSWTPVSGATSYDVYIGTLGDDALSTLPQAQYNALFNDPSLDTDDPATRGGIYAFQNIRGMMMISMPGNTDPEVQADLLALCQNDGYKFALLDPAPTTDVTDWHQFDASTSDIITQRGNYDSEYGALYYPWICIEDPTPPNPNNVGTVNLSPSPFQMGITARVDINRGVYKAPANEIVQTAIAFSHPIDQGTQDVLNPLGINCYRDFSAENYGLRIWGARTVSSNGQWKYINIRRLFQYIEASIQYGTEWVVFEPNNAVTWARVRQSVSDFLTDTWRSGALMGSKPSEAFYVICDVPDTMSISDVQNGRLICEIGIAPTYPAEFVIFQISQWTGSTQGS